MILFFRTPSKSVIATEIDHKPSLDEINELCWLYGDATLEDAQQLQGFYVGPRREMITPWSTNAVEITQNMSLDGTSLWIARTLSTTLCSSVCTTVSDRMFSP